VTVGWLILTCLVAAAQMKDYQDYKDPALFTRMPHYFLTSESSVVEIPFDAYEFTIKAGTQRVEGRHLHYTYEFDESVGTSPGFLQIVRNYEAAAKKIGGEILSGDVRRTNIRIAKDGRETWVALEAFNEGRKYELHIIERQLMKQDVAADAAALRSGLLESGHVVVPGIFVDFGKSDVKPESEPALKELTAMLQANAALKVWVVGHTDNLGAAESNMTLSGARAAAVIKALVQRGIGANRLAPHGTGPYAPVASNATEEGRARNRRVELVARP
jgi:outer membrane protein OmpA-like peptidoglycan-associated protein